ncbi:phosphatase PAP2 family protein [Aneurinibacillus migulanus]|uniref:PAP2 superfamily protein n=2 Tax=Aneurinibacillus migulanus TaxID=47500 RepID=A0A1G8HSH9_ANEMI|nr:phosphatase PAP2 family protein [Aneurinibacillus migulanus]MCP1354456.1 phosphatase PAP2 family protein [Aneurinibacillus migulanus]MED0891551.1 phosphatase PAP2 family protein [Aneurinibacillus migulanus]MED1613760.1 phosphatase PAP2 family protein [Aneurinibacillus migulanus]MED4728963.1 phosphatase PAP2 family protein [Aneurinibacillus migulanus]SDI09627.1 PAP2 superfamily protein [Aneurinibacillus migulanus]
MQRVMSVLQSVGDYPKVRRALFIILFICFGAIVWNISTVENWIIFNWLFLGLLLLDFNQDQKDVPWLSFLPKGVFLLFILYFIYRNAPHIWYVLASYEKNHVNHWFNWNELFRSIPFNDAALFRVYQPEWFTIFLRWVYGYGFSLALWVAVIRSFLTRDAAKMLRYVLSSHTFQLPIIVPFYATILLQEVWYVLGHPDGMARNFTPEQAAVWSLNCFPSMHTSVSFAILLLALREKGKIFRRSMVTYCSLVIFSTMYLEIHWIIDVIAGMVLGYATVKLVDKLYEKLEKRMEKKQLQAQVRTSE